MSVLFTNAVDLQKEQRFLEKLRKVVLEKADKYKCRLFLFGSRVSGTIKRSSDFDIGVSGLVEKDFRGLKLELMEKEDLLNIPHHVELVNFESVDDDFRKMVFEGEVKIWKEDWRF